MTGTSRAAICNTRLSPPGLHILVKRRGAWIRIWSGPIVSPPAACAAGRSSCVRRASPDVRLTSPPRPAGQWRGEERARLTSARRGIARIARRNSTESTAAPLAQPCAANRRSRFAESYPRAPPGAESTFGIGATGGALARSRAVRCRRRDARPSRVRSGQVTLSRVTGRCGPSGRARRKAETTVCVRGFGSARPRRERFPARRARLTWARRGQRATARGKERNRGSCLAAQPKGPARLRFRFGASPPRAPRGAASAFAAARRGGPARKHAEEDAGGEIPASADSYEEPMAASPDAAAHERAARPRASRAVEEDGNRLPRLPWAGERQGRRPRFRFTAP